MHPGDLFSEDQIEKEAGGEGDSTAVSVDDPPEALAVVQTL